jgi:hypothetical protein
MPEHMRSRPQIILATLLQKAMNPWDKRSSAKRVKQEEIDVAAKQ